MPRVHALIKTGRQKQTKKKYFETFKEEVAVSTLAVSIYCISVVIGQTWNGALWNGSVLWIDHGEMIFIRD